MSFFDFLLEFWGSGLPGLLLAAFATAAILFALIGGTVRFALYASDEWGWGWNLLIVPVAVVLGFFILTFGVWWASLVGGIIR